MTIAASGSETRGVVFVAGLTTFFAVCGAATVIVWQAAVLPEPVASAGSVLFFLLIVPVEVLLHEAGHLAVAKSFGWRVPLVSWGPLTLRCSSLELVFGAPAFGHGTAGAVVAAPPVGRDHTLIWALVFAGGPLANALLAVAALLAGLAAPSETPRALMLVTAAISAAAGLFNLWPRRGSDGAQILNVLRFKNGIWRGLRARLVEQSLCRVRPRDWPTPLVAEVQRLALWSDQPDLLLALYRWHLDRGETAAARAALSRSAPDARVAVEQAFVAAWFDCDAPRALLNLAASWSQQGRTCYWRAVAAAAQVRGDIETVRAALRQGRILVRDGPYETAFDAEWFDAIEREL